MSTTTPLEYKLDGLNGKAPQARPVLFDLDLEGQIVASQSPAWGWGPTTPTVGRNLYDLFASLPAVLAAFERARDGEPATARLQVPGRVDTLIVETTYLPVHSAAGPVTSVRGVAVDITPRLRAQKAEQKATQLAADLTLKLEDVVHHLHTAREDERRRVARELHDGLSQTLTALSFETGWLRRHLGGAQVAAALQARLDDVSALVHEAATAAQRIAVAPTPQSPKLMGPPQAAYPARDDDPSGLPL